MTRQRGLGLACFIGGSLLSLQAGALSVTTTSDGSALANAILGSGISISNVSYTGGATASGTFTDGLSSGLGIESGIILTSGDATLAPGPNDDDGATGNNGLAGLAALTTLAGATTYDATYLTFDFESSGGNLFFNYVFASEEYNEYVNSPYNDVFAFFLDGVNIATIPGSGGTAVAINNLNCGNPYGSADNYCDLFNNNDLQDGGPFFDLQYDGFTDVLTASFLGLTAGTHTMTLAIADTSDRILDSAVFIQAGTFSDTPTSVPEPGSLALLGLGLAGLGFARRRRQD